MKKNVFSGLSDREMEVLRLFKTGLTNQEIADNLGLTLHTIKKFHMTNIYKKLGFERHGHKSRELMAFLCKCEAGSL